MIPVIKSDKIAVAQTAYRIVHNLMRVRGYFVFGLCAGKTPLLLFNEMINGFKRKEIDFADIHTFNLDEFVGFPPGHPKSFYTFMRKHLFKHINLRGKNIHYLDGSTKDLKKHCMDYEQQIMRCGGIDFQILGIGSNGHIGFNEPGSALGCRTGVRVLLPETIAENRKYFQKDQPVPRCALSMGVGTIVEAKHVLLLATGSHKAEAVAAMVEGPVTSMCPASALQMHPNVTVICDEEAAARLQHRKMYTWQLQNQYNAKGNLVVYNPRKEKRVRQGV